MTSIHIVKTFVKFIVYIIRQILLIFSYMAGIGMTSLVLLLLGKKLICTHNETDSTWEPYSGNNDTGSMF